jgi:hypothetical protein
MADQLASLRLLQVGGCINRHAFLAARELDQGLGIRAGKYGHPAVD